MNVNYGKGIKWQKNQNSPTVTLAEIEAFRCQEGHLDTHGKRKEQAGLWCTEGHLCPAS